jgi:hypothetical protein
MALQVRIWAAGIALAVGLAGCGGGGKRPPVMSSTASSQELAVTPVVAAGTALPAGYKIDAGRTLIFGTDETWTGRLSYTTNTAADDVFDFLHREMPSFGWTETTAMRSDVSLISFASNNTNRVATIHIERGGALGGNTRVDMVVSPGTANAAPSSVSRGAARAQAASQPIGASVPLSSPVQR